jgi:two-component system, NtrC family, C4-dicarboxylate transport sensor histidine kinase DctB
VVRTLPNQPVMVMGDRLRLEQVIINLMRNAVDATAGVNAPQIDLILTEGDTVTLTVRDNGTGIKPTSTVFEPFYTSKKPGEGVGLGLAISSGIVADHGGRITARNMPEGGAAFDIAAGPARRDAGGCRMRPPRTEPSRTTRRAPAMVRGGTGARRRFRQV